MADLAQLIAWRDALRVARYRGIRSVHADGRQVTYASDAEMAAALADLDRRIAAAQAVGVTMVRIAASKGV